MEIDYISLGKRIAHYRNKAGLTQEQLSVQVCVNFRHISQVETGRKRPSLDTIISLANALNVSADDLLVDSLTHSVSTSGSELHRLLLDCSETEQKIITRTAGELKKILSSLGI